MKILFCMNQIIMGGIEKVLCQYIDIIKDIYKDAEIKVISKSEVKEQIFIDFFKRKNISLLCSHYDYNKYNKWYKSLVKYWHLYWLFNEQDLIIDFANFSFVKELKMTRKPKIAWFHGSIFYYTKGVRDRKYLNIYDKFVCLTNSFLTDFKELYPQYSEKIVSIYNPIDLAAIRKESENVLYHTQKPYFVAVQRLNSDKDVTTIIRAFNLFFTNHKDYKLYIVGNGPEKERLEKLSNGNSNICFTGQLDNSYAIIKNAEAVILSSTSDLGEGLGVTLLEAQALGTLGISTEVKSGPAEILMNGKAGILFEQGNFQQLAQIMEDVVIGKIDKKRLIETATSNFSRFCSSNIKKQLQELIKSISQN